MDIEANAKNVLEKIILNINIFVNVKKTNKKYGMSGMQ